MKNKGALLLVADEPEKGKSDEQEPDEEKNVEQEAAVDAVKAIKNGDADAADLLIQTIKACMSSYGGE